MSEQQSELQKFFLSKSPECVLCAALMYSEDQLLLNTLTVEDRLDSYFMYSNVSDPEYGHIIERNVKATVTDCETMVAELKEKLPEEIIDFEDVIHLLLATQPTKKENPYDDEPEIEDVYTNIKRGDDFYEFEKNLSVRYEKWTSLSKPGKGDSLSCYLEYVKNECAKL